MQLNVIIDGSKHKGMMSIGSNPTVNDNPENQTIEVNIFDFEKEIYKSKIMCCFQNED